ncbi:MAG: hypothetical protein U1F51_13870 [Burkholderiales bacterium]
MYSRLAAVTIRLARVASLFVAVVFAPVSPATVYPYDVADLWWSEAESGWGVQMIQQHGTVFATLYVYRADTTTDFYVAVLAPATGLAWSGPVYHTSGPWYGGAWNPAQVAETPVGTMSFEAKGYGTGELKYTIGATSVAKNLTRMSIANDHIGGTFVGAGRVIAADAPCTATGPVPVVTQFNHTGGQTVSGTMTTPAGTYTFNGSYTQVGRYGFIDATYTSTQGETGTVVFGWVAVTAFTVTFQYQFDATGPSYSCGYWGAFAGTVS